MLKSHPLFKDTFVRSDGRIFRADGTERVQHVGQGGYLYCNLPGGGTRRRAFVHVLVAEVFIGPRLRGLQVRHLDCDKYNNTVSNLAYGTPSDNAADSIRCGISCKGEAHPRSKLTDVEVSRIRELAAAGWSATTLAIMFRVGHPTISRVARGCSWKHVTTPGVSNFSTSGAGNGAAKLTPSDVIEVARRYDANEDVAKIAADFSVSSDNVHYIGKRKGWATVLASPCSRSRIRKLTREDVTAIRGLLVSGGTPLSHIGRKYGVSYQTIARIRDLGSYGQA